MKKIFILLLSISSLFAVSIFELKKEPPKKDINKLNQKKEEVDIKEFLNNPDWTSLYVDIPFQERFSLGYEGDMDKYLENDVFLFKYKFNF